MEAELTHLKESRVREPNTYDSAMRELHLRIEDLESELANKENENSSLLKKIDNITLDLQKEKALTKTVEELECSLRHANSALEEANAKLLKQSDYDQLATELDFFRSVEFPEDWLQSMSLDNEEAQSTTSSRMPLEVLLVKKAKMLENHLAEANLNKKHLEDEIVHLKASEAESKQCILEQSDLIKLLESDLCRVQSSLNQSTQFFAGSNNYDYLSPQQSNDFEGASLAGAIGDQKQSAHSDQQTLLHIVQSQRDRYRLRVEELDQNEANLKQQVATLQHEIKSVRNDNVKLYEKIRFLHSYASPMHISCTAPIHSQNSSKSAAVDLNSFDNDAIVAKYSHVYESQLDPFNQFSRSEKQKRYKNLKPHEKIMLHIGRLVTGNRKIRLGAFLYALFLHLFVFVALYKAAHFQHSAQEANTNCFQRYAEHMRQVHNQAAEDLHF